MLHYELGQTRLALLNEAIDVLMGSLRLWILPNNDYSTLINFLDWTACIKGRVSELAALYLLIA